MILKLPVAIDVDDANCHFSDNGDGFKMTTSGRADDFARPVARRLSPPMEAYLNFRTGDPSCAESKHLSLPRFVFPVKVYLQSLVVTRMASIAKYSPDFGLR